MPAAALPAESGTGYIVYSETASKMLQIRERALISKKSRFEFSLVNLLEMQVHRMIRYMKMAHRSK